VFQDGDSAVLDMDSSRLSSQDGAKVVAVEKIPAHVKKIVDAGGLVPYIKRRLGKS
jgi:3-isopropylmalate/(R)-2-methylmalate dehydratase small subunit